MLKTMRSNIKSLKYVLWFVVATFIISIFVIWGGSGRLNEGGGDGAIAVVAGKKITPEEYVGALRNRIESLKQEMKEIDRGFIEQLNLPQQVLQQIVEQGLVRDAARDMGIKASDAELRDRIVSLPGLQRDGKFIGYQEYQRVLAYNHIDVSQFENSLREEIVLSKTIRALTAGVVTTPEEAWDSYKKTKDTTKVEYLALEKSKIEAPATPGEAEVKAYFEAHKDKYKIPERRDAAYVFFRTGDLKKEIELSEAEIGKYYQGNKAQFETPEQVQVSRIYVPYETREKALVAAEVQTVLARARQGEDFASLARTFSKDDKAAGGGDWGLDGWRSLSRKEQDAVAALDAGKVSDLLDLNEGVSILKVVKKDPAVTTSLEAAKPRIRTILQDERARALAGQRAAKLEKDARKAKSLESAAKAMNLKVEASGPLKEGQSLGDVDPSGSVSGALFKLKEKEISTPVFTYGGAVVAQLRKIESPRAADFAEARIDAETDLIEARRMETALARIKEARGRLKETNWEDVASKSKLEIKTVNEHKKEQYVGIIGESAEFDRLAFSLPLKQVSEPIAFDGGYALMRVLERKEMTREDFEKDKATETASLADQKKNKFLQAFLAKRREEKKVKVNYEAFLSASQDVLSRYEKAKQ